MKTFNNRPVFLVDVDNDYSTITAISLVDDPAMQLPMYCFDKDMMKFSMEDELKHNIISCIVRVDYPILRLTEDGNPFYIVFSKEASEKLCQKLMTDGFQQNISLDHNHQLIEGIQLQEVFLKDSERGISPVGFEDAADGSLFGVYHITDDALWQDCLDGRFGGVSLESYVGLQSFKNINNKNIDMASKIKEMLKRWLMEFNNLSTDKAELYWEEDSELMVGYRVFVNDADGNKVPAADGEYVSDENIIKVEDGIVTEIDAKEGEEKIEVESEVQDSAEAVESEVKMEEVAEVPTEVIDAPEVTDEIKEEDKEDKTEELESRIADLESRIADLETKLVEIATAPAASPVVDEFEKVTKRDKTGDKKLDKRIAIAAALREN